MEEKETRKLTLLIQLEKLKEQRGKLESSLERTQEMYEITGRMIETISQAIKDLD